MNNLERFILFLIENNMLGDIIEFGTFSGNTAKTMALLWSKNKGNIFTIDGWMGLPKSEKELPSNGAWNEGEFTGNKLEVEKLLKPYENVKMIDSWINKLEDPKNYEIGKIVGANIDVDIYESTMDSLKYLLKCEWVNNEIIIRFDDWNHPDITEDLRRQVFQHNKLAYEDFLKETKLESTLLLESEYVAIFKLKR
jgi:hypothetical protein